MFGSYSPQQLIGKGSFGAVYRAIDSRSGATVAVKVLTVAAHLEQFRREAQILFSQDTNANVVQIYDWNLESNPPYIVEEFCDGGSLRNWVGHAQPWPAVVHAIRDAAKGLAGIHAQNGFHRDVKPDNLLLWKPVGCAANRVKVSDFGIARCAQVTGTNMTFNPRGTQGYMAPELFTGAAYTWRADIYSLGVTAVELLTGVRDMGRMATMQAPPAFKGLLQRMLALNPAMRPTAFQVARTLDGLLRQPEPEEPVEQQGDLGRLIVGGLVVGLALTLLHGK